MISRESVGAA
jgi:hypothetical protein